MRAAALLLLASLALRPSAAAPAADLTGTWVLDLDASDPPGALLEETGASWIERQAAANMSVTWVLRQAGDTIHASANSALRNREETWVADGQPRTSTDRNGEPVVTTVYWEGGALVTRSAIHLEDGRTAILEARRTLEQETLVQTVILTPETGPPVSMRRVFRRRG